MVSSCAVVVTLLAAAAAQPAQSGEVSLRSFGAGKRLEIETTERVYRLTIVNPKTGETSAAVSTDGKNFSQPATVYFLGATQGRQAGYGEMLVLMGKIKRGLRVELGLGSMSKFDRALTEPVTEIRYFD